MGFDVEKGLISKLLQTKDIVAIKDNQIRIHFFTGDNRSAYQYIYDQTLKTGETPSVRAFQRKFPNYELEYVDIDGSEQVGTEENIQFWCDEVRQKVRHNNLADVVDEAAQLMGDFKAEEALSILKQKIAYIESEVTETSDINITDTEGRKEAYLKRKQQGGMLGISTGFKHLDYILKGLAPATLTTLIAQTSVGKTWFQIIVGANAVLVDYKVLHLITEMSEDIMRDRYEAVLFSKCCEGFNYNSFKSGTLSLKQERKYFEFLENDLPSLEQLVIATATGVMGVSALIDKYTPDLVMIDSAYLMEDDQGAKDDWLRVAHITRDLKKLAKRAKVPIFINTQADKNTSKKVGPELGHIMYTQAIGQDSDNVIALFRDKAMISDKEMSIKVLKQREGTLGKTITNWNFDKMDFSEIYMEDVESSFDEENNNEDIKAKNTLEVPD